jgi:hypothetical protein
MTTSSSSSEDATGSDDSESGNETSESSTLSETQSSVTTSETTTATQSTQTDTSSQSQEEQGAAACAMQGEAEACEALDPTPGLGQCRWIDIVKFTEMGGDCSSGFAAESCVWVAETVEDDCPAGCGAIFPYYRTLDDGSVELSSASFSCGEMPHGFSRCEYDPLTGLLSVGNEKCSCACGGGD